MFLKLKYQDLNLNLVMVLVSYQRLIHKGYSFHKFGVLNMLYANIAKGRHFGHICPKLVRCLVRIVDKDLIPCSA